ncbi:hypothetical protein HPHPP23_1287 [Helicobacter pylori Hp P-23]|nr:hypothetical protein HPHPP23_1287 [Helicobacter pylori Hp P-23]
MGIGKNKKIKPLPTKKEFKKRKSLKIRNPLKKGVQKKEFKKKVSKETPKKES